MKRIHAYLIAAAAGFAALFLGGCYTIIATGPDGSEPVADPETTVVSQPLPDPSAPNPYWEPPPPYPILLPGGGAATPQPGPVVRQSGNQRDATGDRSGSNRSGSTAPRQSGNERASSASSQPPGGSTVAPRTSGASRTPR